MNGRTTATEAFDLQRALSHALAAVRLATGPMWVGGVLMSVSDGCGGGVPANLSSLLKGGQHGRSNAWLTSAPAGARGVLDALGHNHMLGWVLGLIVAAVLAGLLIGIALFGLNCWVSTGFVRLHVHILEHAGEELAPLFTGRDRFWAMAGFKLLQTFSVTAAGIVAAWPGALLAYAGYAKHNNTLLIGGIGCMIILALPALIYVALGAYLGELAVVLETAPPVQALRRAWGLASGNRFPLMLFGFVCGLLQFVSVFGVILCCVGVLATVPLARALVGFAKTESYLLLTRDRAQSAGWKLWQKLADEDRVEPVEGWGLPPGQPPA